MKALRPSCSLLSHVGVDTGGIDATYFRDVVSQFVEKELEYMLSTQKVDNGATKSRLLAQQHLRGPR